jgi:hypothetical protein
MVAGAEVEHKNWPGSVCMLECISGQGSAASKQLARLQLLMDAAIGVSYLQLCNSGKAVHECLCFVPEEERGWVFQLLKRQGPEQERRQGRHDVYLPAARQSARELAIPYM